jgi:hypothetical protein
MPSAPLERVGPRGLSARSSAFAMATAMALVVGGATVSRWTGAAGAPPSQAIAVSPGAGAPAVLAIATPTPRSGPGTWLAYERVRVVAPTARGMQRNNGSMRVTVRGISPPRYVRAAVIADGVELGVRHVRSDERGVVDASVGLYPTAAALRARLVLHEAASGYLLAEVPFTLKPGLPVSVFAPTGAAAAVSGRLWVFGATLPTIRSVTLRLRLPDSSVLLGRKLTATESRTRWRAFSADLKLPQLAHEQLVWLDVSWNSTRPESGVHSVRIPLRVVASRDDASSRAPRRPPSRTDAKGFRR